MKNVLTFRDSGQLRRSGIFTVSRAAKFISPVETAFETISRLYLRLPKAIPSILFSVPLLATFHVVVRIRVHPPVQPKPLMSGANAIVNVVLT